MPESSLSRILKARRNDMLDRWVDAIKLSTQKYADSPDEFLHESAENWIDGVYHAVAESDYSHLTLLQN